MASLVLAIIALASVVLVTWRRGNVALVLLVFVAIPAVMYAISRSAARRRRGRQHPAR